MDDEQTNRPCSAIRLFVSRFVDAIGFDLATVLRGITFRLDRNISSLDFEVGAIEAPEGQAGLLDRPPLRFLLAGDVGAGKTIMAAAASPPPQVCILR
jgi:hypothetical protein